MLAEMNNSQATSIPTHQLHGAMVGMGMIFDETYRPFLEAAHATPLFDPRFGVCEVKLAGVASRTGKRADAYRAAAGDRIAAFESFTEPDSTAKLLATNPDFVCVATPDDRHFEAARQALLAKKHTLIEKPSVLSLAELDELDRLARENDVLAKVVYHKLLDPDHKKLRTLVVDGTLQHINSGYCTLLEPKQISGEQFAEWITGRNPGTYVAVHYIKLIDFTFGGQLRHITCSGQRGIVGPADGPTWDSTQLRMIYRYPDGRDAAFDIHTSWVTPDNFPGYVEQEVQFRFDNGIWNGHSRRRGVECTIEGQTPNQMKISMNNHYNGTFVEPDGQRSQRGYGLEVLERFVREVAFVEYGGSSSDREERLRAMRTLDYNDVSGDRQVVAAVQAMEAILDRHVQGTPNCVVNVNEERGGLVLHTPGSSEPEVLYEPEV